jgi:hypothetical protein
MKPTPQSCYQIPADVWTFHRSATALLKQLSDREAARTAANGKTLVERYSDQQAGRHRAVLHSRIKLAEFDRRQRDMKLRPLMREATRLLGEIAKLA